MSNFIARSYLFVPGNRPDRFDKACAAGADVVILDLEDAVAPDDKVAARIAVADWLQSSNQAQQSVAVRINSADTIWYQEDVQMCKNELHRGSVLAGIVLPKAERAEDITWLVSQCPAQTILPLIESAAGMWNAHALASCAGVQRLLFGSIDFQLDLHIQSERLDETDHATNHANDDDDSDELALLYFRSQLVLVSRVAGIQPPVDGVTTSLNDTARLRRATQRAKKLGFGGKLCIHPNQVNQVNQCFQPSAAELSWATRVITTAASANGTAIALDGKMVDKPVLLRAQAILANVAPDTRT